MRLALLVALASAPAFADEPVASTTVVPEVTAGPVKARVFGALRPTFGVDYQGEALPRDRWAYGIRGSTIDAGIDASVGGGVSALLYVIVGAQANDQASIYVDRAIVRWQPDPRFQLAVGRDRVPLSVQSATPTAFLLFPSRISFDQTFVLPADVGAQATLTTQRVSALVGVWNGIGGDTMTTGAEDRGLLYSARVELTPLGPMAFDEDGPRDQLRLGFGLAATYRAATAFTDGGQEGSQSRDLRAGASARVAWHGLLVQGEVLRRQITDDLSMRPDVATAAYLQASWRFGIRGIDVAPIGRAGIERVRQMSAPAQGSTLELGGAVFPLRRLRIAALYEHLVDPDLGASEHALVQARLQF